MLWWQGATCLGKPGGALLCELLCRRHQQLLLRLRLDAARQIATWRGRAGVDGCAACSAVPRCCSLDLCRSSSSSRCETRCCRGRLAAAAAAARALRPQHGLQLSQLGQQLTLPAV